MITMERKDIRKQNVPAWYELGIRNKTDIMVRVHKKPMRFIEQKLTAKAPIVERLQEELHLPKFIAPTEEEWGFGKIIGRIPDKDPDWVLFRCSLPVIINARLPKSLDESRGQIDKSTNWEMAFNISATLQTLFQLLRGMENEEETGHALPQLLVITGFETRHDFYGGALSVKIGKAMRPWLARQPDESEREELVTAMMDANKRMFPFQFSDRSAFSADFYQGYVRFRYSGHACSLDPVEKHADAGAGGFMMDNHNSDNPYYQFLLLAGVAAMYDLARKEGV